MKHLNQYIIEQEIESLNEGLLDKLMGWFKNLFKTQKTLEKNTLDVDSKEIKGTEKSVSLEELEKNKEELNLINDLKVGFPIMSQLLKNKQKYLTIELSKTDKQEYKPMVDRYFYVKEGKKYYIGIVMYDESIKNENGYINLLNLEVIPKVNNKSEIEKFIDESFKDKMKNNYKGSQYVIKHPRIKPILIKLGYKTNDKDKNIIEKEF